MILALICSLLAAVESSLPDPRQIAALLLPPPLWTTNKYAVSWNPQWNTLVYSNQITWANPYKTNQWWINGTNAVVNGVWINLTTQAVFSLIETQKSPPWSVTVSSFGFTNSSPSKPANWPPRFTVIEFYTLLGTNRQTILIRTNPTGVLFARLWLQPTNLWIAQASPDLRSWTNLGPIIIAPGNPRLKLNTQIWRY